MNKLQDEYIKAERHLKMTHSHAYITIDGVYVMVNGQPVGDHGLKWWVYRVIGMMGCRMKKKKEEDVSMEEIAHVIKTFRRG